eukprot:6204681-Pleurochrysis_carterae.AAC.2
MKREALQRPPDLPLLRRSTCTCIRVLLGLAARATSGSRALKGRQVTSRLHSCSHAVVLAGGLCMR